MLIIHGDNLIASRDFFLTHKKQNSPSIDVPGVDLTLIKLQQSLNSQDLFGSNPMVYIENFFSRRISNEKKKIIDYLQPNLNIVFYDSKDVTAQVKAFNTKIIKYFPYPKLIYTFLESFNLNNLLQVFKTDAPELVLGALAKHIHNLILVKSDSGTFPSWQSAKLKSQSQKYSLDQLINMENILLQVDLDQKTSQSPLSLSQSLELWCIKINNNT